MEKLSLSQDLLHGVVDGGDLLDGGLPGQLVPGRPPSGAKGAKAAKLQYLTFVHPFTGYLFSSIYAHARKKRNPLLYLKRTKKFIFIRSCFLSFIREKWPRAKRDYSDLCQS
jgi:hypothetical protein